MKRDATTPNTYWGRHGSGDDILSIACTVALCILLSACPGTKISPPREVIAAPASRSGVIYVTDFELWAQDPRSKQGLLAPRPAALSSLGAVLPPSPGVPTDPAVRAHELVELMATSLVEDLTNAGLNARRLSAGDQPPADGWLVRGMFTEVDESHQLRRAVIGPGEGQTDLQLFVAIDDLAQGTPPWFYRLKLHAGRSAVVTLNSLVAAKYSLSGRDLDINVKQSASTIAADIAQRVQQGAGPKH